jgi:two-component system sensor histidine kinase DesK
MRAVQAVVALTLLVLVLGSLNDPNWSDLGQGIVLIAVVGIVTISMVRSVSTGRELRVAREEIARLAVMTERLRIARDLHDLLGHNLSLIALKSELAGRLLDVSPERAAVEIGDVEQVARTTLQEVREAVGNYRQPTLSSELHGAEEILAAAGIAYRYEGDESIMDTLPTAIEAVLAWTVREGVTNVIRHSRAHQCIIRVTREKQTICVEVIDDGVGVPPLPAAQPRGVSSTGGLGNGGNGLRGLAERVAALGGLCEAGSRNGGGFLLTVSLPLAQKYHDAQAPGAASASRAQRVPVAPEHAGRNGERSEQL